MPNKLIKILIATDSFKSSLSSGVISNQLSNTLINSELPLQILHNKLADGGEGSLSAISDDNVYQKIILDVYNPLFEKITAYYLYDNESKTAFIELAQASGIQSVKGEPDIMQSSSYGTGSLMKYAIEQGAKHIILFVGGSATNDAGLGILSALGFKFTDINGQFIDPLPKNIEQIHKIDDSNSLLHHNNTKITIAADVTNTFYGINGAAYSYAAQKGASEQEIAQLDRSFMHLSEVFCTCYNVDIQTIVGSGASGGVAGGLYAATGAKIVSGADYIFQILNIEDKIKNVDIVISGEGKIDTQSVNNKLLFALSKLVRKHNKKLWAICGYFDGDDKLLQQLNIDKLFSFTNNKADIADSIAHAELRLENVARQIIQELKLHYQ